jgi:hypothetical protein
MNDRTDAPTVSPSSEEDLHGLWQRVVGRRSFLKGVGLMGATAALPMGAVGASAALADDNRITSGDIAILRFLAAAEIIETDLWQQYAELGGSTVATRRTSRRWRTSTATCRSTSLTTPTTR